MEINQDQVFCFIGSTIIGFFIGMIFEVWVHVDLHGPSRYLFVFLVPFVIFWIKKKNLVFNVLSGLGTGLAFSDIHKFMMFLQQYAVFFIVIYAFYCYAIYVIYKLHDVS